MFPELSHFHPILKGSHEHSSFHVWFYLQDSMINRRGQAGVCGQQETGQQKEDRQCTPYPLCLCKLALCLLQKRILKCKSKWNCTTYPEHCKIARIGLIYISIHFFKHRLAWATKLNCIDIRMKTKVTWITWEGHKPSFITVFYETIKCMSNYLVCYVYPEW